MNNEYKQEMNRVIETFRLPRYQEIPNVGLYLEQTSKYIGDYLAPLKDMSITASMVSNYVKKKLVRNPVHKQYDREQIAALFFIAVAKSVLSLDNIRMMLDLQKAFYDPQKAYDYFCEEFETALRHVFGLEPQLSEVNTGHAEEKIMLRKMIVTVAHKVCLDEYFERMKQAD